MKLWIKKFKIVNFKLRINQLLLKQHKIVSKIIYSKTVYKNKKRKLQTKHIKKIKIILNNMEKIFIILV